MRHEEVSAKAGPGRTGLWIGILAYRWMALAWMSLLAATTGTFRSGLLAGILIAAAIAWNVWWTVARGWLRPAARWADLGVSVALLLLSGVVQVRGGVLGDHPFFATAYPVASAMTVGAAEGLAGGVVSGLMLSIALVLSRPLNGTPLGDLTAGQVAGLGNGVAYYLAAGVAVGLVSRVLTRTAVELRRAEEEAVRERERVARLAERDFLGRQIHDSVLQALAMVNKRGKELAALPSVPAEEVRRLAEVADEQARALRALVQRDHDEAPAGTVSLRTVLQAAAFGVSGIPVGVTTVDPVWLPTGAVEELSAAIRQALDNVARAGASQASVFGEREDRDIVISVRDDGVGFDYNEDRLRREGKLGMLRSMKGRIEDLGGSMRVASRAGAGTEIEFRLPAEQEGT